MARACGLFVFQNRFVFLVPTWTSVSANLLPGVRLDALRNALLFIDDMDGGAQAWVDRRSGAVHILADALDPDELALPEDLGDPIHFLAVPGGRELGIERELACAFVAQHLPADLRLVCAMFTRKGARRALHELLAGHGLLPAWYRFKEGAIEEPLAAWCDGKGLRLQR